MNEMINTITQGDCLEVMKQIPDRSVDMILADLPYGTTACKWDTIIPFDPLWEHYERVIKDKGAIVLTASQPFTSALVMSNPKIFRYQWVWEKDNHTNFLNIKKQPGKRHEDIAVFYKRQPTYNPQMWKGAENKSQGTKSKGSHREYLGGEFKPSERIRGGWKYPISIIKFNGEGRGKAVHPTQKPVALFEYLIRTYTNEGETVLDNVIGSGTTAVAAINTGRNFIGIEKETEYVDIARRRVDEAIANKNEKESDNI